MGYAHHKRWPYARVLAHRGGGTLAPENTVAALKLGLQYGFKAVEFDAVLSADGMAVLLHDETLDRTTNARGSVAQYTAAQLTALDAGSWFGAHTAGEPIPTLTQALTFCRAHDIWVNLEIKPVTGFEVETGHTVGQVVTSIYADCICTGGDRADQLDARVPLLSSFSTAALAAARASAPDVPRGWLTDRVPDDWCVQLESLGCVALHTNQAYLTAPIAQAIKEAGFWLFCYTVNTPARAQELRHWGVDAFCTDRIDLIGAAQG